MFKTTILKTLCCNVCQTWTETGNWLIAGNICWEWSIIQNKASKKFITENVSNVRIHPFIYHHGAFWITITNFIPSYSKIISFNQYSLNLMLCPKSISDVNTKYQRKLFKFYPDPKQNIKKKSNRNLIYVPFQKLGVVEYQLHVNHCPWVLRKEGMKISQIIPKLMLPFKQISITRLMMLLKKCLDAKKSHFEIERWRHWALSLERKAKGATQVIICH